MSALLFVFLSVAASPPVDVEPVVEGTIRFPQGSAAISDEFRVRLLEIGRELAADDRDLLLIGHSDRTMVGPSNRELSRRRATAVAKVLRRAGVQEARIEIIGAGYGDPLDPRSTPEADALNRRVEILLVGKNQVAWVSWRHRRLEAKKPEQMWFDARVKLPLATRDRVRTVGNSAGEVTFRRGYVLYIGPHGSLVIFEPKPKTRRVRRDIEDVRLEAGTLLARLPGARAPDLRVGTAAAQIDSASRDVRIEYLGRKETSLVSVYEGRVQVAAMGHVVRVRDGYGTRVRRGRRPETPTKLPAPPAWPSRDPILSVGAPTLNWETPSGRASIAVTRFDDPKFVRPMTSTVANGASHRISSLAPGAYRVRLREVDDKGLVGRPGPPRDIYVLRPPELARVEGNKILLDGPGPLAAPRIDGRRTELRREGGIFSSTVSFALPGTYEVEVRVEGVGAGRLAVEVGALDLTNFDSPTEIVFRVTDSAGAADPNVRLAYRALSESEEPCGSARSPTDSTMVRCARREPETPLKRAGLGQFRMDRPLQRGPYLIQDLQTGLGRVVFLEARLSPPEAQTSADKPEPEPEPERPKDGPHSSVRVLGTYLGLAGGAEARDLDRYVFTSFLEVGIQTRLLRDMDLRTHLNVGFSRFPLEETEDQELTTVPVAFGFDLVHAGESVRPWFGFGFGVRYSDLSDDGEAEIVTPSPFVRLAAGLGFPILEHFEGFIAIQGDPTPLIGVRGAGAGFPYALIGFRTRNRRWQEDEP